MTKTEKIIMYLYNRGELLESEYLEHLHYARFHKIDEVDHLESIIRKVRVDLFKEFSSDILAILGHSVK